MSENSFFALLPKSRPHRRSSKRAPHPAITSRTADGEHPRPDAAAAAVQALAELAVTGMTVGARALRELTARLPRP